MADAWYLPFDGVDDSASFSDPNRNDSTWELEIVYAEDSGRTSGSNRLIESSLNTGTFLDVGDKTGRDDPLFDVVYRVNFNAIVATDVDAGEPRNIGDGVITKINIIYTGSGYLFSINDNAQKAVSGSNVGFRLFDSIELGNQVSRLYTLTYWSDNTRTNKVLEYKNNINGSQPSFPELVSSANAVLTGFSSPPPWVLYDDGGGGTGVTADGSFNIPALTVSSSASATLPQPSASGAFDLSALTIASNASATLPQPDATGSFNLTALTVSGASSATLPQPSASGAFDLSALTVDGSVTASLPNPTLTGAFNLNTLTVSGNATATTPNFTASGAFDLPAFTVTGSANSTQPNPTANGNFDIGALLFSGASSATLPQPSASAAFNLNTFNFTGSASVTEPTFTASGAFNLTAITVSGSGSATFPQPSASGSFALPQLQINGNITVSGLIITPSQDAILYASVGGSINYTDNTSNILYLH